MRGFNLGFAQGLLFSFFNFWAGSWVCGRHTEAGLFTRLSPMGPGGGRNRSVVLQSLPRGKVPPELFHWDSFELDAIDWLKVND